MQKVFNNPEMSFEDAIVEGLSEAAKVLMDAEIQRAEDRGFKAGHQCHIDHPEIPVLLALSRWQNGEPQPPRRIF